MTMWQQASDRFMSIPQNTWDSAYLVLPMALVNSLVDAVTAPPMEETQAYWNPFNLTSNLKDALSLGTQTWFKFALSSGTTPSNTVNINFIPNPSYPPEQFAAYM